MAYGDFYNIIEGPCVTCRSGQFLKQLEHFHDGAVAVSCCRCESRYVRHECYEYASGLGTVFPLPRVWWLLVLQGGLSLRCPLCKTAYQLVEEIQRSPDTPEWVKGLAGLAQAGLLIYGGYVLGDLGATALNALLTPRSS